MLHAARQLPAWLIFNVRQKMRATVILLLLFGGLAGCCEDEPTSPDAVVITRLVILETDLLHQYYSGDKGRAERALVSYLEATGSPKFLVTTDEGKRMLHDHRSINMARLAFLRRAAASDVDLRAAVSEKRLASSLDASLPDSELIGALQTIVSGDPVPWIRGKE